MHFEFISDSMQAHEYGCVPTASEHVALRLDALACAKFRGLFYTAPVAARIQLHAVLNSITVLVWRACIAAHARTASLAESAECLEGSATRDQLETAQTNQCRCTCCSRIKQCQKMSVDAGS